MNTDNSRTGLDKPSVLIDERDAYVMMFTGTWRLGRERLRQQFETLAILFAAAQKANDEQPALPNINLAEMSEADAQSLRQYFEEHGTATGTRDAYASAVVFVIDDILKMVRQFYNRIPGLTNVFGVGVNGYDLFEVFRTTGNNIRHYLEWRAPTHQIPKANQAFYAVTVIATVVGRPVPPRDGLSVMANNWAWPVLHAVGGGDYAGLIAKIRGLFDELIRIVGMENDPLVLAEIEKET